MARARDTLYSGRHLALVRRSGGQAPIRVWDPAWWRWLDAPGTTCFRFEQGADGFTARRERREGGWYWYAYRKRDCGSVKRTWAGRRSSRGSSLHGSAT